MKKSTLNYLLIISIILFTSISILFNIKDVSIGYVVMVISFVVTLFSILVYKYIYLLVLKIFGLYKKTDEEYLTSILYFSIIINIIIYFFIQGTSFEFILFINPALWIVAPFLYSNFKNNNYKNKQIFLFYSTLYFINAVGALVKLGVC